MNVDFVLSTISGPAPLEQKRRQICHREIQELVSQQQVKKI